MKMMILLLQAQRDRLTVTSRSQGLEMHPGLLVQDETVKKFSLNQDSVLRKVKKFSLNQGLQMNRILSFQMDRILQALIDRMKDPLTSPGLQILSSKLMGEAMCPAP